MRPRGFSLIELILVIAVAGIIFAIALPMIGRYMERSRVVQAVTEIDEMSRAIVKKDRSTGVLAATLADAGFNGRLDPWGFPYAYYNHRTGTGNGVQRRDQKLKPLNSDFDLYSVGRDGVSQQSLAHSDSRDDVVRARDGGFVGTSEEFDP
jgi:general secretion pathway protein G